MTAARTTSNINPISVRNPAAVADWLMRLAREANDPRAAAAFDRAARALFAGAGPAIGAPSVHDVHNLLLGWTAIAKADVDASRAAAFDRAARALFQSNGGRTPKDDRGRLAKVLRTVDGGMPAWAACHWVARQDHRDEDVHAVAKRLYKKLSTGKKRLPKPVSGVEERVTVAPMGSKEPRC